MNKLEFSKRIASRMSVTQQEALKFIRVYQDTLAEVLIEEGAMASQGFGTFTLWSQNERAGRNPQTGSPALIPARNSVKFKPGKELLRILNEKKDK